MTSKQGNSFRKIRIFSQIFFFLSFFFLLIQAGKSGTESFTFTDSFFYLDPLLFLLNIISTHTITILFFFSLIPVLLTVVVGRFFCGWVCPMGTIHHFFSWVFKKSKKEKKGVHKNLLKVKYLVLIFIIISSIVGTQIGGWLDPFSLLTRSVSVAVNPSVNYLMEHSLKGGAMDTGVVSKVLKPVYKFSRKNVLTNKQRVHTQTIIIGLIFFAFIFLNLYRRRFFCNYVCPLGALYGFISKFSFFNLKVNDTCKTCNVCANNCTYNGSPYKDYMKSECMTCFNCVKDCPSDSIDVKWGVPKKSNRTVINIGRRKILGSILSGLFIAPLPRISVKTKPRFHNYTRPPGSVSEKNFLKRCVRCGECMQVCPTNFIQPALFQTVIDGIWTPVLNAQSGYCEYECNKCTQVCPTSAIEELTVEQKKMFVIGIAIVDKNRCYTYADGYNCAVCEEHCPVPEKAIRFREVDVWNFQGKLVKVKQIYIVPDLCIGCGICENVCPRLDAPGIILTAEEEQREAKY